MKNFLLALAFLWAVDANAGALQVCVCGGTGELPSPNGTLPGGVMYSGGPAYIKDYPNPTGQTIYVKRIQAFIGESEGTLSDTSVLITRQSDGVPMFVVGWDHYAEPTSAESNNPFINFAPDYMVLLPGDYFECRISFSGVNINPNALANIGVSVRAWYTVGAP